MTNIKWISKILRSSYTEMLGVIYSSEDTPKELKITIPHGYEDKFIKELKNKVNLSDLDIMFIKYG